MADKYPKSGGGGNRTPVRDGVTSASTRVFSLFIFHLHDCRQTGRRAGYCPVRFRSKKPGLRLRSYPAIVASLRLADISGETSRSVKPREPILYWQLCFSRMFNGANRGPRRATKASTITSKPVAPIYRFSIFDCKPKLGIYLM